MITDNDLYSLAIFLGSMAMLLIVLYHFLEVNAKEKDVVEDIPKEGELEGSEIIGGEKTVKEKGNENGRGKEKAVRR